MTSKFGGVRGFFEAVYITILRSTLGRQSRVVSRDSAIVQSALLHSIFLLSIFIFSRNLLTNVGGRELIPLDLKLVCVATMLAFYIIVRSCTSHLGDEDIIAFENSGHMISRIARAYPFFVMGLFVLSVIFVGFFS